MNTEELRIGNYVLNGIGEMFPANIATLQYPCTELGCIHPIPLTEDILLKCGFYECIGEDVNGYKKYINDDHLEFDVYLNSVNHCCVHYLEVAFLNHPQSLHSLQNAIFALTGEELNVEL